MSLLSGNPSLFNVETVDSFADLRGLVTTLAVASPPSPTVNSQGTPVAGTINPGTIVVMNASGLAALATAPDITTTEKVLPFVVFDGNVDFSGAYVQKLTCITGGIVFTTPYFEAGTYTPGLPVTFNAGQITAKTNFADKRQIIGWVGPAGVDAATGVLQVIMPQSNG